MARLIVVILLLNLFPRFSFAENACAFLFENKNISLSNSIRHIVRDEKIPGQEDSYYINSRYALRKGGLCGPHLLNILMTAVLQNRGQDVAFDRRRTAEWTDLLTSYGHYDARYGSLLGDKLVLLDAQLKVNKISRHYKIQISDKEIFRTFSYKRFSSYKKDIVLISVFNEKEVQRYSSDFKFIITKVYSQGKFVWNHISLMLPHDGNTYEILDPLDPKQLYKASLKENVLLWQENAPEDKTDMKSEIIAIISVSLSP